MTVVKSIPVRDAHRYTLICQRWPSANLTLSEMPIGKSNLVRDARRASADLAMSEMAVGKSHLVRDARRHNGPCKICPLANQTLYVMFVGKSTLYEQACRHLYTRSQAVGAACR